MRRTLLAIVSLPLFACVPVQSSTSQLSPDASFAASLDTVGKVKGSSFEPNVTVNGVERPLPGDRLSYFLIRSFVFKTTGTAIHQVYVSHYYWRDGWIFWDHANFQDATPLEFTKIASEVSSCSAYSGGCGHTETFGVDLSDSVLRRNPDGFSFKVYARSGPERVITVDARQTSRQIALVDSILATLKR